MASGDLPYIAAFQRARSALADFDKEPELASSTRNACWECSKLMSPGAACASAGSSTGQGEVGLALAALATIIYLPFCWARRRERLSFATILSRTQLVATEEVLGLACSGTGVPKTQVIRLAEVAHIQDTCCGPCAGIDVYGRDPATGARKLMDCFGGTTCCGRPCYAPPDMSMSHLRDIAAFRMALSNAVSSAAPPSGMPKAGSDYYQRG